MNLSQKETMLLNDLKSGEQICVKKYSDYANQSQDPELKQLFNSIAKEEQQHLDSINSLLAGQVPNVQSGAPPQPCAQNMSGPYNQKDADLCTDLLMTEKHISRNYDISVFEFTNQQMRDALNHIQKEEQQHGKQLFDYMHNHGMYPVK